MLPFDKGETKCQHTEKAPADSPKIVTLSGSPNVLIGHMTQNTSGYEGNIISKRYLQKQQYYF